MTSVMKPFEHSIKVGNKRYAYTITPLNKKEVHFECKGADISQRYAVEDVAGLLLELPEIIQIIHDFKKEYTSMLRLRVSPEEKRQIQQNAIKNGYSSVSSFIRDLALSA